MTTKITNTETTAGTKAAKVVGLRWLHHVELANGAILTVTVTNKGLGYAMEVSGAASWDEAGEAMAVVAENPTGGYTLEAK